MVFACFTLTVRAQSNSRQITEQLMVDGMNRKMVIYIPANAPEGNMPLVISLHGGFATPNQQFKLADFRPLADRDKFIVVCPASKRVWHDGANNDGIDDIKFIDELINHTIKTYHADPNKIYITGISNGGFMTTRLARQLNNRVAAIAVIAATLSKGEGYEPVRPMPVLYMHGTTDPIVSYYGGKLLGRRICSHDEVIDKWVKLDQCQSTSYITTIPDTAGDGTSIKIEEFVNPVTGIKVLNYTINNGGHTWPGGWQYFPKLIIGKTTRNLDACSEIWDFFKQYKLSVKS
jgi:polyhydroxybutyrate depolymerase